MVMLTVEPEDYVSLVKTHKKKCNKFYSLADQDCKLVSFHSVLLVTLLVWQYVLVRTHFACLETHQLLPVQICAGLHLKVFGNSTRPAPAAAKLGYQGCPTPLCVPLSTLHPQGGLVGCLDIVVVRKYPLMVSRITSLSFWLMTVKNASPSMWSALSFLCVSQLLSGLGENLKRWLVLEKWFSFLCILSWCKVRHFG